VRVLKEINAAIETDIRELGGRAVGLHSGSLQCLFGDRLRLSGQDGNEVDLGRVGAVTRVDDALISNFCAGGVVPVIPSLALDGDGAWLNVNADTAAAAVAASVHAEKLVVLTDTPGILNDRCDAGALVPHLDAA